MMRTRRTVLAGVVVAGLLGGNARAGTVLGEPEDSALGWWSGGAGDEGIGSAPLPTPVADSGDWTPRRGSLYGAINRTPPVRVAEPFSGWHEPGGIVRAGGGIGVLQGGGSGEQPTAGCLTVCVPWGPMDFSNAVRGRDEVPWPGAVLSTGGGLYVSGGGAMMQGGASAEIVSFSPDLGGLTLIGSGDLLLSDFASGNIWTVGPDGSVTQVGGAISIVPEPGSLAAGGMAAVLIATGWLRARRRTFHLRAGCFARAEWAPSDNRTYGYEAIT